MNPVACAINAGQAIQNCCSAGSDIARQSWAWLQQPQKHDPRIFSILRCIAYVLVGVALTLYIGWKGIELAQSSLNVTRQANELSVKSICSSVNLTLEDQHWCENEANNLPLSSIMDSLASHALAAHSWVYSKLAAFGLCGTYSMNERSGETCLSIGILLAVYLLARPNSMDKYIRPEYMQHLLEQLVIIMGSFHGLTYVCAAYIGFSAWLGYLEASRCPVFPERSAVFVAGLQLVWDLARVFSRWE